MIRALIVDDEAPARDRLRRLLEGSPIEIAGEAADGNEAIERAADVSPDVVFLDIQMPGLSGLEVAARLPAPRPRIVFCTAYDQFALQAFEHHAVDYLLKPVSRERLGRVITRLADDAAAAQRTARERDEAATVQARLMPDNPSFGVIECAARAQPAHGVGGDYFDVLPMPGGRVALTVGDVSGKGLYAGILAAAVQGRMQSLASGGPAEPDAMLEALNRLTVGGLDPHRFITLALAVLDERGTTLSYAAAGHPPALLLHADGSTTTLDATGPVIGWPGAAFAASRLPVRPRDILVLYSDGVTEASSPDGEDLGVAGLAAMVRRHGTRPAGDLVAAVLDEVDRFTAGAPPADDRTLLVARVGSR